MIEPSDICSCCVTSKQYSLYGVTSDVEDNESQLIDDLWQNLQPELKIQHKCLQLKVKVTFRLLKEVHLSEFGVVLLCVWRICRCLEQEEVCCWSLWQQDATEWICLLVFFIKNIFQVNNVSRVTPINKALLLKSPSVKLFLYKHSEWPLRCWSWDDVKHVRHFVSLFRIS